MIKKKTIREKMDLITQIENIIGVLDYAWASGKLDLISRTIENLRLKLWPWFPEDKKEKFDNLSYKPEDVERLYEDGDRKRIERFGYLESTRHRKLDAILENKNRKRFYFLYGKKYALLMNVFKGLGIGFSEEEEAHISHDKKKPVSTAGRY